MYVIITDMHMDTPYDLQNERYILMKDTPGERPDSSFVGAIKKPLIGGNFAKQIIVPILRGELIGQIPRRQQQPRFDGPAHNYFVDNDPSTTLFADVPEGISPLCQIDYRLLRGIDCCFERFSVFANCNCDWLEWGANLKVGDEVYVRLPAVNRATADWSRAVIRYKGDVKSLPGTCFGVEIDVSTPSLVHSYVSLPFLIITPHACAGVK